MRGLKTLKMTLSIGDHLRPWNAMFWVVTTSYTMFLWFWVKTGPSGPKKGRFWPKQGMQKSGFFSKTPSSNLLKSHKKYPFGSITMSEKDGQDHWTKIFQGRQIEIFGSALKLHWLKLTRASQDTPGGSKWPQNSPHKHNT